MQQKCDINKIKRSVNYKFIMLMMLFGMILPGLMATQAAAFEIITKEDIVEKTVIKEDFIKTADNFIVLMDTSQSMNLMNNANIDEDRIVLQWFGKLNPVVGNDTAEGRSMNRRVEIAVGME